jgi:hypothetical protein
LFGRLRRTSQDRTSQDQTSQGQAGPGRGDRDWADQGGTRRDRRTAGDADRGTASGADRARPGAGEAATGVSGKAAPRQRPAVTEPEKLSERDAEYVDWVTGLSGDRDKDTRGPR